MVGARRLDCLSRTEGPVALVGIIITMNINTLDKAVALLMFLLGVYITTTAMEYGYAEGNKPAAGFFPFWVGLFIAGLSVVNFVRSVAKMEKLKNELDMPGLIQSSLIALLLLAFIFVSEKAGMMLSCAVFILLVAKIIQPEWNRRFALKVVATAVLFPLVAFLIFSVYLNVPIPVGTWFS